MTAALPDRAHPCVPAPPSIPAPSTILTRRFTPRGPGIRSVAPDGQMTSIRSIRAAPPSPKWLVRLEALRQLERASTTRTWRTVSPPVSVVTTISAPTPARFESVPSRSTASQLPTSDSFR